MTIRRIPEALAYATRTFQRQLSCGRKSMLGARMWGRRDHLNFTTGHRSPSPAFQLGFWYCLSIIRWYQHGIRNSGESLHHSRL